MDGASRAGGMAGERGTGMVHGLSLGMVVALEVGWGGTLFICFYICNWRGRGGSVYLLECEFIAAV